MDAAIPLAQVRRSSILVVTAWALMLLVSDLPNIIWRLFSTESGWLVWGKAGAAIAFLALSLVVPRIRPLWRYFTVLLTFVLVQQLSVMLGSAEWWQSLFTEAEAGFIRGYLGIQTRELVEMALVVGVLWLMMRDRHSFFLAKGFTNAPIEPVRWLGIHAGENWKTFGWIFAASFFVVSMVFVVLSVFPNMGMLGQIVSLLPYILLFSAVNALGEELTYRTPLLATTHSVIGSSQALWLTAVFFGLSHFLYGDPSGPVGFLLTGFVAYLFGKSMLETRGVLWAWTMHFFADIPIFTLLALSLIQ